MLGRLLMSLLFIPSPSVQHWEIYVEPCILAKICNHSWIPICGRQPQSLKSRLFIDECDMFEYNCDNTRNYQQIEFSVCHQNMITIATSISTTTEDSNFFKPASIITTVISNNPLTTVVLNGSTTTTIFTTTAKPTTSFNPTTATSQHLTALMTTAATTIMTITVDRNIECTRYTTLITVCLTTVIISTTTPIKPLATSTIKTTTMIRVPETVTTAAVPMATELNTTTKFKDPSKITLTLEDTNTETTKIPIKNSTVDPTKELTCGYNKIYPKDCNRPSTWETTSTGETRDFFRIIRAQYGRQARLLKGTTIFPPISSYNALTKSLMIGRHVDSYD